jgi:hypothetical protein
MAAPMKSQIPLGLDLDSDYIVQFTALSPTDGSVVANVAVSNVSLLVENVQGGDLSSGFGDATPLWVPVPNNLFSDEGE